MSGRFRYHTVYLDKKVQRNVDFVLTNGPAFDQICDAGDAVISGSTILLLGCFY